MEDAPVSPAEPVSFPVAALKGAPSHRIVFKELPQRFQRMPECEDMSRHLHARIEAAHDAVAAHDDQWKAEFCGVLKRLIKLLHRTPLLERLAGAESIAYTFRELNLKMDEVCMGIGVINSPNRGQWKGDWTTDCQAQAAQLERLVRAAGLNALIREVRGEKKVVAAMVDMYLSLEEKTSGPLTELKRETLERLCAYLRLETRVITADTLAAGEANSNGILSIFRWYIPEREVEFADAAAIGDGTYGSVYRGKWHRRDGVIQNVAVKSLYDIISYSEGLFPRHMQLWYELPQHRNIIRLFGGSHLATRPFFVCEDAPAGDIVQFLGKAANRGMLWSMFLEVAEGLKFLHDHHIAHDGLRGSNILVGENHTPKISDFACLNIRSISLSVSASLSMESSIRWKPRERVIESTSDHYKADIYSLGMCIIEAMTQDIPFGADVTNGYAAKMIIAGEPYKRPDANMSDEEWGVISRLIAVNMNQRPDIKETISLLRSLAPPAA